MSTPRIASTLVLLALTPIAAGAQTPSIAQPAPPRERVNAIRFQVARLSLRGDGDYWPNKELTFTGGADDFRDLSFAFDYQRQIIGPFWLMLSLGIYESQADQAYRGITDAVGNLIVHTTTLERANVSGGLLIYPIGREVWLSPYVGASVGYYGWRLQEEGDFLNFVPTPPEIEAGTFADDGGTSGYSWIVGLEVPIYSGWTGFVEARWQRAAADLGGDFIGFGELDLSSRRVGAGLALRF